MTKLPITGAFRITAVYGQQGKYWKSGHKGIDFAADNRRIYSTCEGTVRQIAYDDDGWGQYVSIEDEQGLRHIFCHMVKGSVTVKVGDRVNPLSVIGTMGATGNVTGIHLHYQLQRGNTVLDPTTYLGIPNRIGNYHSKDFAEVETLVYKDADQIPAWAKDAVQEVTEKGLMLGDDQGYFKPNQPLTRAELAVVLTRLNK